MIFTFSVAALLCFAVLAFVLPSISISNTKRARSSQEIDFSTCFQVFSNSPFRLKMLFLAHFFSYGASLLITVYATSWVGISVLDGMPTAEKYTLKRRIFEMGVSWGAFALLLNSLVCMLAGLMLPILKRHYKERSIWGVAQALAAIALLAAFKVREVKEILVILPLCGFALSTVVVIANIELEKLTRSHVSICPLLAIPHSASSCPSLPFPPKRNSYFSLFPPEGNEEKSLHLPAGPEPWAALMTLTSLLGQVTMFSVIPTVLLMWPEEDDNKWGMVTAGVSSMLGAVCAFWV
jgi:hypothetical protein